MDPTVALHALQVGLRGPRVRRGGRRRGSCVAKFREPYAFHAMAFVLPILPEKRYAEKRLREGAGEPRSRSPTGRTASSPGRRRTRSSSSATRGTWGRRAISSGSFSGSSRQLRGVPGAPRRRSRRDLIDESLKERARRGSGVRAVLPRWSSSTTSTTTTSRVNNRSPFFSDARVRRAVTMLLDRPAIVRSIFRSSARIISGPWAPDSPAYDASVRSAAVRSRRRARKLLDEAGWRDTQRQRHADRDGPGVRLRAPRSRRARTIGRQIDEMLAAELAKRRRRGARAAARVGCRSSSASTRGNFEAASLALVARRTRTRPVLRTGTPRSCRRRG